MMANRFFRGGDDEKIISGHHIKIRCEDLQIPSSPPYWVAFPVILSSTRLPSALVTILPMYSQGDNWLLNSIPAFSQASQNSIVRSL